MRFRCIRSLCYLTLLISQGQTGVVPTATSNALQEIATAATSRPIAHHISPDHDKGFQLPKGGAPDQSQTRVTDMSPPTMRLDAFLASLSMILVSEFGDKTFIIALLLSMKHSRLQVFTSAFSALTFMTIISAVLGKKITSFLPEWTVGLAAGILFLVLGAQMLREASRMPGGGGFGAEMEEVEIDLQEFQSESLPSFHQAPDSKHAGEKLATASELRSLARMKTSIGNSFTFIMDFCMRIASSICSPFWVRTFSITVLAEWGDRSQVSTMAMASGPAFSYVVLGAVSGHLLCTGLAVLSGRSIAGKVSMKLVTFCGAVSFLCFGIIYIYHGLN